MEDFINWVIDNKEVLVPALLAIINGVITFVQTRKSRINKIVSEEKKLNSLTQKVKERLKKGD